MGIVSILLLIVFVISSLLLILLVMLQGESGDELGGLFGGGMNQQMGMRSGNILTRITGILGVVFFLSAFGVAWVNRTPSDASIESVSRELDERVQWWSEEDAGNVDTSIRTGSNEDDAGSITIDPTAIETSNAEETSAEEDNSAVDTASDANE